MTHELATNAAQLAVDPISAASPDMNEADFKALVESIRAQGQLVPIVVHNGQVIDGRKRLAACRALGLEPATIDLGDVDPASTATALNLLRTHYSLSERGLFAGRLATLGREESNRLRKGSTQNSATTPLPPTIQEAARIGGVSVETVRTAKRILRNGSPEVVEAVERGKLTLNAAEKIVDSIPKEEQPAVVTKVAARKVGQRNMMAKALGTPTAPRRVPQRPPTDVLTRLFRQMTDGLLVLELHRDAPLPDNETRREWIRSITDVMHALRKYKRRLEEERWES